MIFVTVGTTRFDTLVKEVDKIAPSLKTKVVIQRGNGSYQPKNCKYFDFDSQLNKYIEHADLVISHGGAGTIFEALNMKKKLICVENPNVNDSHQWDLLQQLHEEGYIIWCKNAHRIKESIELSKKFRYKRYVAPRCTIADEIVKFLK